MIDELDKVQPATGEMIPRQPDGYLAVNHLWSAKAKEILLYAARNEFVAFQVLLHGTAKDVRPSLSFDKGEGGRIETTFATPTSPGRRKGRRPILSFRSQPACDFPPPDDATPSLQYGSLYVEIYVPHDAAA